MKKQINSHWFTLIEMIVSVTILAIIMLSIFVIYRNIIFINKKLELDRIIQQNSRNIIESLATEIRDKWIDYSYYSNLTEQFDYSWSGNTILAIANSWEYCMQKQSNACSRDCYKNSRWCFLWKLNTDIQLSDEKVQVNNLRFFISDNKSVWVLDWKREWKVTIVFDLSIAPNAWINANMVKDSSIHIQTTISTKFYKNMN